MLRKLCTGLTASLVVFILPALLIQPDSLVYAKLWCMVGIGLLASITQPAYSPLDSDAPPEDRGTARQLVWTVYLTLLAGVLECLTLRYPQSVKWDLFSSVMLSVAVAGALFRAWAVAVLGRFFTWHVRVQDDQHVITSGPYCVVRHPSYTGAWFLYVGALLFIHAWLAAGLAAVSLLAAFVRRIRYEETLMLQVFGDQYRVYSSKVRRLIPLVW
jgi:protein-S-isoprenylcysteine O-methyltransferase